MICLRAVRYVAAVDQEIRTIMLRALTALFVILTCLSGSDAGAMEGREGDRAAEVAAMEGPASDRQADPAEAATTES